MIRDEEYERREIARVELIMENENAVFVFGSNRAGVHGGGAARVAFRLYGAKWGVGEGQSGRCYGIPTKDTHIETLPLDAVAEHVGAFLLYAESRPDLTFAVTRVGCGLAGHDDAGIAPLFKGAATNCELPEGWRTMNCERE